MTLDSNSPAGPPAEPRHNATPWRIACLVLLLAALAGPTALAQSGTGGISGRITDEEGNPVGGGVLRLIPVDGSANMPQQVKINKKGRFAHGFLPIATYRIELKGSDAFLKSMVYVVRDASHLELDRIEAAAHPERGLRIQIVSGQRGELELVVADAGYRAKLSQRVAIAEASGDLQRIGELLNAGKLDDTVEETNKLLEQKPDLGAAYYLRGSALYRLYRFDDAESDLRRAIELVPEQPGVHSALGDVMLMQGDRLRKDEATGPRAVEAFGEAADLFAVELERDPEALPLAQNLALALELTGERREELAAALERVVELDPSDRQPLFRLAELAALDGNYQGAVEALERMSEKDRETAAAMLNVAVRLYNEDRLDETLPIVERALEIDPEFPELHRLRAGVRLVQGDQAGAIRGFERFLELAPPDAPEVPQTKELLEALRQSGG